MKLESNSLIRNWLLPIAALALVALALLFAAKAIWLGGTPSTAYLPAAVGWGAAILFGLVGLAVVYRLFDGSIDLSRLVSEPSGEASMSRFQLFIFTFVIAASLMLIIVSHQGGPDFPPTIPPAILGLLGISAGSYIVSKGIQKDITLAQLPPMVTISASSASAVPGQTVILAAAATGSGNICYQWQRIVPGSTTAEDLTAQTAATLNVTPNSVAENGTQYQCKVGTANGEAISNRLTLAVAADRG
jgi:hypothetical protein